MNKVLIISSTFPPNSSVGGLRPAYFFKYFNDDEIDAHIFSVQRDTDNALMPIEFGDTIKSKIQKMDFTKADELYYLKKRSISKKVRDFFNPTYSLPPGLLDKAKLSVQSLFDLQSFDLIIATVPDLWTADLAYFINKKYKVKYIIDFRDAYEQEVGMPRSFRENIQIFRMLHLRTKLIRNSIELITVSKYLAQKLSEKYKKKTSVIYNGFDNKIFNSSELRKNLSRRRCSDNIKIVYIGRLLNTWYRNPTPLLNAISALQEANEIKKQIELHFYGSEKRVLEQLLRPTSKNIFIHSRVPHQKVNDILMDADVLLVLTNLNRKGILTTKLFEYMPLNKPILVLPNNDEELLNIMEQYGLGYSLESKNDIIEFFRNYQARIKEYQSKQYLRDKIDFFTREHQSKKLAKHIKRLL